MPHFKYYNLQLLPLETKTKSVGEEGYVKLFEGLSVDVKKAVKKEQLFKVAADLRNHFHFAPIAINFNEQLISGKFIKYDEVDVVIETLSRVEKYSATGVESSKVFEYIFVFDPKTHILAIEDGKSLPSATPLINALVSILDSYRVKYFEDYHLTIIELSAAEDLDHVIENAEYYYSVESNITFSNSQDWLDGVEDELEDIEQELKDKGVHELNHQEKSARGASMTEPSNRAMAYMALSCKYGNSEISYKKKDGGKEKFIMKEHAVRLPVAEKIDGRELTFLDFLYEIKSSIRKANELARAGKRILKKLTSKVQ